jgi:hypothetical protein
MNFNVSSSVHTEYTAITGTSISSTYRISLAIMWDAFRQISKLATSGTCCPVHIARGIAVPHFEGFQLEILFCILSLLISFHPVHVRIFPCVFEWSL